MAGYEEWRTVSRNALYEVSNLGRVRRITYITPQINSNGYPSVSLWKDNHYSPAPIHRLVAEAFIDNPIKKPEVNHKDGDKLNPRVDNLEWVTRLENQRHAIALGLIKQPKGEKHGMSKLTVPQVRCIRAFRGIWRQRSMARHFGVTQHTIVQVQIRNVWKHVD